MSSRKNTRLELSRWIGQSVTDKLVILLAALVVPSAGWLASQVTSALIQQVLLFTSIAGAFSLALLIYFNRRMASMVARQQHSENLHAVGGYIVRHRLNERPRTGLESQVLYADPKIRERDVLATLAAHRRELRNWINTENPDLSIKAIDELLDNFYGHSQLDPNAKVQ